MHIFEALMKDHEKVKELLTELVSLDESETDSRRDLVKDIRDELIPHARAEESVFYNSIRALDSGSSETMHGYAEHMEAETLLRLLQVEDKVNMGWKATAQKLKDAVEHHIKEEESKIFSKARTLITQEEAKTLGDLFEKLKPQIQDEGILKTTLEMMVNTLPVRLGSALKKAASNHTMH
jgi:hypothetical protein